MIRRLAVSGRRLAGGGAFLLAVCALWFAAHLWRIDDGPNGFHEWREADTCMVAWNLHTGPFDLLRPRISVLGYGDGVVGQEFPLYNAAIAAGWRVFGEGQHWWARLLSIAAALALIVGLRRLLLDLRWPRAAAGLAAAALACSPLLFFYGRKIIPDMPAAALALWGALLARRWLAGEAGWRSAAGAALLLALAGMIKPLALCVGLPLAVVLLQRHGWRGLLAVRFWLFGLACLLPMFLWFHHANTLGGSRYYFLIGVPWQTSLAALQQGWPFGKLLVEWPWQLWIGMPMTPLFFAGCWVVWRGHRECWVWWWLAGAFAVLLPFAGQFGPHDYYTVVMLPPCAILTGAGLAWALRQSGQMVVFAALVLLAVAGPLAFLRIDGRYGTTYDHRTIRAAATVAIPPADLVVAYDSVPSALLYRLGRNGWWIEEEADLRRLPELVAHGARFIAARGDRKAHLVSLVGECVLEVDGLAVYRIGR